MKKFLLSALSLFVMGMGFAQTTIDTAQELDASGAENTYTDPDATSNVTAWWKYTATEDVLMTVTSKGSTNVYELVEGNQTYIRTVTEYDEDTDAVSYSFPVTAGKTIYFSVNNYSSNTVSLTVKSAEPNKAIGKGTTENDPIELTTDGYRYFMTTGSGYSSEAYATYNATEDGVLVLTGTGRFTAYVNGSESDISATMQSGSSIYKLNLPVEQGQTYTFRFTYSSMFFLSAEMTHPEPGTLENPFVMTVGNNTLPAAFGDYYYMFTSTQAGYAVISSQNSLPGGQVKVYTSLGNIKYSTYATSTTGSFDVRFETAKAGETYYIVVSKFEKTDADETFTLAMEDYAPGDKEGNPILIDQLPANITCKNITEPSYYAVEIPANTPSKLLCINITNASQLSPYTRVYVYAEGTSYYNGQSGMAQNGSFEAEVSNSGDTPIRYIIYWYPYNETTAPNFDISLKDVEAGDLIGNPLTAVAGDNTLPGDGTKYYVYTATLTGKMVVTSPKPETTLTFPMGPGQYGSRSPFVSGTKYTLDVVENTTYYITVNNATKGDVFTLEESAYGPGESRDTAIEVEDGEYSYMSNEAFNVYIKYTVKQDGMLSINCTTPYSYTHTVQYGKDTDNYLASMATTLADYSTVYSTTTPANAGDVYIVYLNMKAETTTDGSATSAERKVTFTERDFEAGESAATAILIAKGDTVNIPVSDRTMPTWGKMYLQPGEVTMYLSQTIQATLYSDIEKAKSDEGTSYYPGTKWNNDYTERTDSILMKLGENEPAGWHYVKLYGNNNVTDLTLTGDGVVAQGDTIDWPLEAIADDNTISGEGDKYYTYTTTIEGRLSVTVYYGNRQSVKFLDSEGNELDATADGTTYTIEVTEGSDITIIVSGCEDGDNFTLGETEYAQGELRKNPIIVENGEYALDSDADGDLWLQYTAESDGYLTIEWDATRSGDKSIYYGTSDADELTRMGMPRSANTWFCNNTSEINNPFGTWETTVTDFGDGNCRIDSLMNTGMDLTITPSAEADQETGYYDIMMSSSLWSLNYNMYEDTDYAGCYYYYCRDWDEDNGYTYWPFYPNGKDAEAYIERLAFYTGDLYSGYDAGYYYIRCITLKLNSEDSERIWADYLNFQYKNADETDGSTYRTTVKVNAGDSYLVNLAQTVAGTKVTFTESDDDPTGIREAKGGNRTAMSLNGNSLSISGDGSRVAIYSLSGSKIADGTVTGNRTFSLSAGVYIVNINGESKKIMVK